MMPAAFPPFSPHPLLPSGHLQTVASLYFHGSTLPYAARQHLVDLEDGDRVVLHDDCPPGWRPGERTVLLIHGVGGSHRSPYQVRVGVKLNAAGVRTFRMDLRGCGAGARLARRPVHAGRSEDAAAAVAAICRISGGSPTTMVGFSMGGNIVLKLLGEVGGTPPAALDSAIAVSPPIDLNLSAECLERGLSRLYSRYFAAVLHRRLVERRRLDGHFADLDLRKPPRGIVEFDDRVTAPLSGFSGAAEYYRRSSAAPLLPHIELPTLVVAAEDDPVIPVAMFRRAKYSASTSLLLARHGGHLAFIARGGLDPDRRWLDWRLVEWISGLDAGRDAGDGSSRPLESASEVDYDFDNARPHQVPGRDRT